MTSAPKSPRIIAIVGPATTWPQSMTVMPLNGRSCVFVSLLKSRNSVCQILRPGENPLGHSDHRVIPQFAVGGRCRRAAGGRRAGGFADAPGVVDLLRGGREDAVV